MIVFRPSFKLRLASFFLLLSVPILLAQIVIVNGIEAENLPVEKLKLWSIVALIPSTFLAFAFMRAKKWAFVLLTLLGFFWVGISVGLALHLRSFWAFSFVLIVTGFLLLAIAMLKKELDRPFINPMMNWFEGLPKPISGLWCEVELDKHEHICRASHIGPEGVFLFSEDQLPKVRKIPRIKLKMTYKGREVVTEGKVVSKLRNDHGIGVQFQTREGDSRKDLGDFVEMLRSEGHL